MTTTITFAAPLIRAAITTLQASLPAQITAYNAEPANTVDLVAPAEYVFGAADPLILGSGPVIEIASVQGRTGQFSIDRAEFDHDPRVTVCIWHEGDRGELSSTYEMSLGLTRCVIETLLVTGAFGSEVEVSDEGGVEWRTDAIPADPTDDERQFKKWRVPVLIVFRLETIERFS